MNRPGHAWALVYALLLVGVILSISGLLVSALSVLLLAFAGVVFAIFLNSLSGALSRLPFLTYRWSFVIVVVTIAGSGMLAIYAMGSQIWRQILQLSDEMDSAIRDIQTRVNMNSLLSEALPDAEKMQGLLTDGALGILPNLVSSLWTLLWGGTALVIVLFVGLYVAAEPDLYTSGLVKLAPPRQRRRAHKTLISLRSALLGWLIGRLISMAIIGLFTTVGLWLLGVPLPITLGVLAALLTAIPNFGPVLAAVPQALLAFQVGPSTAAYVLLLNVVLQAVESYLITPIVQRVEVSLPPAVTIVAQLLLGALVGLLGVLMAAPVVVVAMVLIQSLYIRDTLGDSEPGPLAENVSGAGDS